MKFLLMEMGTGSGLSPDLTLPLTSASKTQGCSSGELCQCLEKCLPSGQASGVEHLPSAEINLFHFIFPPSRPGVSHQLAETLAPVLTASKYELGPFVEQVLEESAAGCLPPCFMPSCSQSRDSNWAKSFSSTRFLYKPVLAQQCLWAPANSAGGRFWAFCEGWGVSWAGTAWPKGSTETLCSCVSLREPPAAGRSATRAHSMRSPSVYIFRGFVLFFPRSERLPGSCKLPVTA